MIQLEFFPRLEFKFLSDFQKLESVALGLADKKRLISYPGFFTSPKSNDVIRHQHSILVDKILDIRIRYVEEMLMADAQGFDPDGTHETWGPTLHEGVQTWVGLDTQTLQTPYAECLRILQILKIKPYQHVVDLGAAYGRMGVVIGGLYLKNLFTGYEYVKGRVDEGNRIFKELGFSRVQLVAQDLFSTEFVMPEADIYFIYDYGQVEHIDYTLRQIEVVAHKRPVKVVVRGKFTKQIISDRHSWLSLQLEAKTAESFSIYTAYIN